MRVRGKCVAVESTDDGARLTLSGCNGDAAQQFSYNTSYDLVSGEADKCVDVPDGDAGNGLTAQIWECTGAGNQKWHY
jgi:glucosylceramidase